MDETPKTGKDKETVASKLTRCSKAQVKAAINTCAVSATRATFLAGYTYYQTGRYNFAVGSDPNYLWYFRISFLFSVLCAFTSEFMAYYIHRCTSEASKLHFLHKAVSYPRLVFQLFLWALIFYALGLSRIGFVYYPDGCPAAIIPQIIFTIVPIVLFAIVVFVIVSAYKVEKMPEEDVDKELEVYKSQPRMFLIGKHEGIVARVRGQSDILAGRAVYVAGMAQAGLWSYRMASTVPGAWYFAPQSTVVLGKCFLSSASFALAFGLTAAMTLSCCNVFIQDQRYDKYQVLLTYRLLGIIRSSYYAYFASFFWVALAVLFMPWGCQYVEQATINVPIAAVATVLCLSGLYFCFRANVRVKDLYAKEVAAGLIAAPPTPDEIKINKEHNLDEERFVNGTLNQINNFGAQGTLASGFVFYNVVTYFTDILKLPYVNVQIGDAFLFFNLTAICAGLSCAVLDSLISGFTCQFDENREKFLFLQLTKGVGRVIELCFYIGMGSWYMLFAVCGYCKFTRSTSLPAIFSALSIFASIAGTTFMDATWSWVNIGRWDSSEVDALTAVDKLKLKNRAGVFSTASYNVLFLGGFAYNCIIFFNFQLDEPAKKFKVIEDVYVGLASACFGLSITIITLSSAYDTFNTSCLNENRAYDFALKAAPVFKACLYAAALVVLTLIVSFSMIGMVKFRPYYPNWEGMVPVMMWASVITLCLILGFGYRIRQHVGSIKEYAAKQEAEERMSIDLKGKIDNGGYDYSKALEQMSVLSGTSSFVAGNVCYEILFSVAGKTGKDEWQSFWYFICNNFTFAFGVTTVSLTTLMTLSLWEMETVTEKQILAYKLHKIKDAVFVMSFSSLFFWMFGCIMGDGVKYTEDHLRGGDWGSSGTIVGTICCCGAIYVGVSIKMHADEAKKVTDSDADIALADVHSTYLQDVVKGHVNPLHDEVQRHDYEDKHHAL